MTTANLLVMRRSLFLISLPIFFISFSVPVQATQLGASAVEVGIMFSLFTLSLLLLRPAVGWGLDHYGRKWFLAAAMLVYALTHGMFAIADTVMWMYAARLVQGCGAALLLITVDTLTTDLTDDHERSSAMGRNLEVQTRSSIVGATVGFTLIGAVPLLAWQYSFTIFGVAALAGFIYVILKLEAESDAHHQPENAEAGENSTLLPDPNKTEKAVKASKAAWLNVFLPMVLLAGFASALAQPIYLIYLQDHFQLPVLYLSWAFLPAAIVFAVLPSRAGKLRQLIGDRRLLASGLLVAALVYLTVPWLTNLWMFVVLYTVSAVGWAFAEPARKAIGGVIATLEGASATGRTFGVIELYAGIGATLGPVIGGYLYDQQGILAAFTLNAAILMLAALLTVWVLPREDY